MIRRDAYLNKLIEKQKNGLIKVITGLRRSGKSYLLRKIYYNYLVSVGVNIEQIIIIDLEDDINIKFRNPLFLSEHIRKKVANPNVDYYVIIDEIQKVVTIDNPYAPGDKISFIDAILGLMKLSNVDLYVTGSNSKMLSSDILTEFRDRGDEIRIYPLTFKEIYETFAGDKTDILNNYLVFGGMPRTYELKNEEEKSKYLKQLFSQTYLKDILERHIIKHETEILEELLNVLASKIGSLTSLTKLTNTYNTVKKRNLSTATIKRYLDIFIDSFLIEKVRRYDLKGKKYIEGPSKYFFADLGIRNAVLNFRQIEENHLMENLIFNELIARGYNVDVGNIEHNLKDKQGRSIRKILEVDFVVNKANMRVYIQSALNIDTKEKREQEIQSLLKLKDSFKKVVVVKNQIIPWIDDNGIMYVSLFDFLTNESIIM